MYKFLSKCLIIGILFCVADCTPTANIVSSPTDLTDSAVYPVEETPAVYALDQRNFRLAKPKVFDLVHTRLEIEPIWNMQQLKGRATLQLTPHFYDQQFLQLDAKNFLLKRVAIIDGLDTTDVFYDYDSLAITIDFEKDIAFGEMVTVFIDYLAQPTGEIIENGKAINSDLGLYFIDPLDTLPEVPRQLWTHNQPQSAYKWFPTINAPNQRCTQEVYITVDTALKTLSNGVLKYSRENANATRTDYWKMNQPHPPYLFMIAAGEFAVVEDFWKGIPLTYYVEEQYEPHAKAIFGNTPEMLEVFSSMLKVKYPWEKYAQMIVRDFVAGGMENTTATLYYDELHITTREAIDISWDDIIAHELFHQWFGDYVTCESWSNIVLNEGLATYGEYLWNEYKYGKDEADYWWLNEYNAYFDEFAEKSVPIVRFEYESENDLFDSHTYAKGGMVFHMLRNYLGDDAFLQSLTHYLKKNQLSSVELSDLRKSFEYISGQDLTWFFDQWFLSAGHPVLEIDHQYDSSLLTIQVKQIQDMEYYPLYKLPVFVDVYVNGERERFPVEVVNEEETFEINMENEPDLVVFDGDRQLVSEIMHPKSDEELAFQYYHANHLISRLEVVELFSEDLSIPLHSQLLISAFEDEHWSVRETAISSFIDYDGDLKDSVCFKLKKIATTDKKSDVRAMAIAALSSIQPHSYTELFTKRLEDSSLYASSEALAACLRDSTLSQKDTLIQKYLESEVSYHIHVLAEYFAENERFEYYDWFLLQLKEHDDFELWSLIYYLNQLNISANPPLAQKSIPVLTDLALNHDQFYVRLAATQGILLFEGVEGIPEILRQIKENEKDENLMEIYNELF